MTREPIWAALFTLLSATGPYVTKGRKLIHWADVPQVEQPALFLVEEDEAPQVRRELPNVWTLRGDIYVYARVGDDDPATAPGTVMNPLLDAICTVLRPSLAFEQTLGGLVSKCRINGAITRDGGVLGNQAVAVIPVEITVPD